MKVKATIFLLCVILFSCKKDNNPNVVLNGTLTDCPANSICTYNYFDNADISASSQPVNGNYRVFWYKSISNNTCGPTGRFYFKAPLNNNNFDINSAQIASGQVVAYDIICPCCYSDFVTKPIGGEIKGKRTDATHWLLNVSIVFGISNGNPTDTLVVNQYFSLEKLP